MNAGSVIWTLEISISGKKENDTFPSIFGRDIFAQLTKGFSREGGREEGKRENPLLKSCEICC